MIAFRPVAHKGKRGANIPNAVVDTAMDRHPDGFGIASREYTADGMPRIVIAKYGPAERKAFRKAVKRIDRSDSEYVVHFRFGTHGPRDKAHAHPFTYSDPDPEVGTVVVFHNGVIDVNTTSQESDTEVFVRDYLTRLPSRWWDQEGIAALVEKAIGWSRLVVMTATETVNLQERDGEWDGGLWYSSNHRPSYKYAGGKGVTYPASESDTPNGTRWVTKSGEFVKVDGVWTPVQTDEAAKRGKSARESYAVLTGGSEDAPLQLPARISRKAGQRQWSSKRGIGRDIDRPLQFRHNGHALTPLMSITLDTDRDYMAAVVCDTCYTTGDVYVIDGKAYIDMGHNVETDIDIETEFTEVQEVYA